MWLHRCVALIETARVVQSAFHDCLRFIFRFLLAVAMAMPSSHKSHIQTILLTKHEKKIRLNNVYKVDQSPDTLIHAIENKLKLKTVMDQTRFKQNKLQA